MKRFLTRWKKYLFYAGFFSLFINLFQLTFPIYMLLIYDKVLSSYSLPTLMVITVIAVAAIVTMGLLDIARSRLLVRMSVLMDKQMSEEVLAGMISKAAFKGEQNKATLRDVMTLRNYLSGSAVFAFFDLPWTPIFIGIIFILHPLLGWVAVAGAIIISVSSVLQNKITRKPLAQASNIASASQELITLGMRNAEAVRGMGMLGALTNRWHHMNDAVIRLQTQASNSAGMLQAFSKGLRTLMQVAIYGVGAWLTLSGKGTPGVMIAASIVMGRGLAPIEQGMGAFKQTAEAVEAYKRLKNHFSTPPSIEPMDLPTPEGAISCEGVTLATGNRYLLQGVQFQLAPGESMGLIGPSAAGKSTLCRLLIGLWPPTAGTVRLDGANVFSWDQEKLGKHIGYLPQDVELFSGTVAENIARLDDIDSEEVVKAAKKAGAHDLILRLPKGYDTQIGQGGATLSGGQRQRVGLARALYRNPKVVILDEPSSNLDDEGEKALLQAFVHLKKSNTTVIVVSHKMSTLTSMDKLLLLRNGRVACFGARQQVLEALSGKIVPAQQSTTQSQVLSGGALKAVRN
jgi:PrtD family type I secretion system ABC transporter